MILNLLSILMTFITCLFINSIDFILVQLQGLMNFVLIYGYFIDHLLNIHTCFPLGLINFYFITTFFSNRTFEVFLHPFHIC
jgi:hypothetical protein